MPTYSQEIEAGTQEGAERVKLALSRKGYAENDPNAPKQLKVNGTSITATATASTPAEAKKIVLLDVL